MDYNSIKKAVESIWLQSEDICEELDEKFDKRQEEYEKNLRDSRPSVKDMQTPFDY